MQCRIDPSGRDQTGLTANTLYSIFALQYIVDIQMLEIGSLTVIRTAIYISETDRLSICR